MNLSKELILSALAGVEDPDLKKDLVSLGMIKDLTVSDEQVDFTVVLTTPACPLKEKIRKDCEDAVIKVAGDKVKINITMSSNVTTMRDK
ncbi:MAG TPA: iron-sulfur cluster assembly protein, partial [Cyclobacteriaceae bacterium]|nr:iron-sulfur cluster assembly protein [Cyclobacteriaceae bacterium]